MRLISYRLQSNLQHQSQQLRVVEVPALIDVADVDLDVGGKEKVFRALELDAWHGKKQEPACDYPEY